MPSVTNLPIEPESSSSQSISISPRTLAAFILIAIPVVFFYPALLGQVVLMPGDGWVQNFGVRVLAGKMWASGLLPLWNPYIFAGLPLLASVYPGVLYPPNWLFALLPPVIAMNAVVLLTYETAIIGSYLFARKIRISRTGAIIAASLFTLGGFMIAHLGHTSRIAAAAWLPWVLLALENLYQTAKWRWVSLGAVFLGLQFVAGEPQMTFNTALLCGLYVLFCLLLRETSVSKWRFAGYSFVVASCGALFSLILYLPARELQQQGARAQLDYNYFAAFSFPPRQILTFIFPYFFGGAGTAPYIQAPWGNSFWGETSVSVSAGYIGLLGLMLGLIALLRLRRNAMIWFWGVVAILSLLLAFGDYLPFGLNQFLYQVPVYNLFRGSYRHLFEYTFAVAMLAGFGVTEIARLDWKTRRLSAAVSSGVVGVFVIVVAVLYCVFLDRFQASSPRLKEFGQFSNPEAFIPVLVFIASTLALWFYARHQTAAAKAVLIIIALLDVATFSWFFEWHNAKRELIHRIPDAATVKYIKSREPDFNSFRFVSHGLMPFSENYEELNFPNNSILRGLQSVNGYDVLELGRFKTIAGEMTSEGKVQDRNAFSVAHRGFDLLNVKYLLREHRGALDEGRGIVFEGIRFAEVPINLKLAAGDHFEAQISPAFASEIAIISSLANSADLENDTPILKLKLHTTEQKIIEKEFLAGRDSAEWAYDRPDVKAIAKHRRATVIESYPAENFEGHRYLARLKFERAQIKRIEIDYIAPTAEIIISRAALHDATTGHSTGIEGEELAPARWRKLDLFGQVEIYENLTALPRAWLIKNIVVQPQKEVIRIIKEGKFTDGAPFHPHETVLMETEDFGGRAFNLPPIGAVTNPAVQVTSYDPHRIQLTTNNPEASFLVLSEIYYRGWDARIDGAKVPVYRVNHVLRGLSVPPGNHRIEFYFRAPSFWNGATYSLFGVVILLIGSVVSLMRPRPLSASASIFTRFSQNLRTELSLKPFATDKPAPLVLTLTELNKAFIPAIALLGFLALWAIYLNAPTFLPIRSDGVGYYLYLPAALIDKDLSLETTIKKQFAGKTEEWMGVARYPATGRYLNRYPLGEAILLSPFFLAGHGLAKSLGVPADGFSWPYQILAALAGLAYFIAGLILLRRVLARHFSLSTTLLTLIVITFGTNLFHYGTCDNIFSHVFSFCLFSALLFLTEQWYQAPNKRNILLLAVVAGLITIVRPTNVIFLLFIPLLGIDSRAALWTRIKFLSHQISTVLIGALAYLITVLPLLSYWKYTTGRWIVNSYQGLSFNWTNPEIINVLFSVRKGLFFWSPILVLGLIGLYFIAPYWKGFVVPAVILLLAHTYIVASWPSWWFGGSFGHRAFTETLPIFAVGYAALLETTRAKPLIYRSLLGVSAILILLCVKFMVQYWNSVIPYDESTIEILASTFFQFTK